MKCRSIGGAVRVVSVLVASAARCGNIGGAAQANRVCWRHRWRSAGDAGGAVRALAASAVRCERYQRRGESVGDIGGAVWAASAAR